LPHVYDVWITEVHMSKLTQLQLYV
jgi:hypothetical protein